MKKTLLAGVAALALSAPVFAQSQTPTAPAQPSTTQAAPPASGSSGSSGMSGSTAQSPSTSTTQSAQGSAGQSGMFMAQQQSDQWLASRIMDRNVYGSDGSSIGDVNDVLLDQRGNVVALVIGVGGFLGIGEKNVAIPLNMFSMQPENAQRTAGAATTTTTTTTERTTTAPATGGSSMSGTASTNTSSAGSSPPAGSTAPATGTTTTASPSTSTTTTASPSTAPSTTTTATTATTPSTSGTMSTASSGSMGSASSSMLNWNEDNMRLVVRATRDDLRNAPAFREWDNRSATRDGSTGTRTNAAPGAAPAR